MSKNGVIRPLATGGCSICRASEDNVGKRRCRHVLDNAHITVVEKPRGLNLINIEGQVDGKDSAFSIKASDKQIKDYISSLSQTLTKKERDTILAVLQDE